MYYEEIESKSDHRVAIELFENESLPLLLIVTLGLACLVAASALKLPAVEPFLEALGQFEVADTGVDAQGFTYVLGQSGSLRKYDISGLELGSTNWQGASRTNKAVAMCVASDGYIYILETARIGKVAQATGLEVGHWSNSLASVTFKSVAHLDTNLFICGDYTGPTTNWGSFTVTQYSSASSLLLKLPAALVGAVAVSAVTTWGFPGINRANSVVTVPGEARRALACRGQGSWSWFGSWCSSGPNVRRIHGRIGQVSPVP